MCRTAELHEYIVGIHYLTETNEYKYKQFTLMVDDDCDDKKALLRGVDAFIEWYPAGTIQTIAPI